MDSSRTIADAIERIQSLQAAGRDDEAASAAAEAIDRWPGDATLHHLRAISLRRVGKTADALQAYRAAIDIDPRQPLVRNDFGVALAIAGALNEAIEQFRAALAIQPDYASAHYNLGKALAQQQRVAEAEGPLRRAVQLAPDHAAALVELALICKNTFRLTEAEACFARALQARPGYVEALSGLADVCRYRGDPATAVKLLAGILAAHPELDDLHSNLLLCLHYFRGDDGRYLLEQHREWARRYAEPLARSQMPHRNDHEPERPLRIGYLSGDFRVHPVAFFIAPILAHHDRRNFPVVCYSNTPLEDSITRRLRELGHEWRNITGLSDDAVASQIRADAIDILIDLSGHSAHGRMLVLARKPAPVQATYLGYPGTTGMTAIDYRLTDAHADPPGMTDAHNVEQLVRLRNSNWCYQPPPDARDVATSPVHSSGRVTFGCFNNFPKVTPEMMAIWARLLSRVGGAKLLLKSGSLADPAVRQYVQRTFAQHGMAPDRIELLGPRESFREHLSLYARVDVALDTFPYHGTTTTCEALYMGVPVVSRAGETHVSRVGASLLTSVGAAELIARSAEQYIEIAARLAADTEKLEQLRQSLRRQMTASPLMDAPRFTRDFEAALRAMWRNRCGERK